MPTSDAQLRASAKYDKENSQHISFKVRIGTRDRIKEAAEATGQSVNSFIKNAISAAMMDAIGKPLEPTEDEIAKTVMHRMIEDALIATLAPYSLNRNKYQKMYDGIKAHIISLTDDRMFLYSKISEILSSDLSPREKKKLLKRHEDEETQGLKDVITSLIPNYTGELSLF